MVKLAAVLLSLTIVVTPTTGSSGLMSECLCGNGSRVHTMQACTDACGVLTDSVVHDDCDHEGCYWYGQKMSPQDAAREWSREKFGPRVGTPTGGYPYGQSFVETVSEAVRSKGPTAVMCARAGEVLFPRNPSPEQQSRCALTKP